MTVRELITELQKLDQDRGIWVFYDSGYSIFPPIPDREAVKIDTDDDVKLGDYIISAG